MTYRNKRLLSAARDRACTLCGSIGTTVAAHSNSLEHGRGMGHKAPDYFVAYVCQKCHDAIDGRNSGLSKSVKREMWLQAWMKTFPIWFDEGIVK